jgi:predicted nucleotidyltransferase component of viral defense system
MISGNKLYYNTVTPILLEILKKIMASHEFDEFRLVGGTALSLQLGHRRSLDIDLFTDSDYDSIDFNIFEKYFHQHYSFVDTNDYKVTGMGKSYYVGNHKDDCIKLDLCYTDNFIDEIVIVDNIRFASINEITAMKIDVISRAGRKKDFWDIHEIKDEYSLQQMIDLHKKRYPYSHDSALILKNLTDFNNADKEFEPICLRGKHWEIIKLDLIDLVNSVKAGR